MSLPRDSGTNDTVPVLDVVPAERMAGDDEEETALLRELLEQAKNYVQSFSWCRSVVSCYFAGGVGKVFAIFLFKITSSCSDVDPWEWIFVGDIPPAYLPLEDAWSKLQAFETYIEGMKRWIEAVREGRDPLSEPRCPPIEVPATPEWAEKLDIRLRTLSEVIRPFFE